MIDIFCNHCKERTPRLLVVGCERNERRRPTEGMRAESCRFIDA